MARLRLYDQDVEDARNDWDDAEYEEVRDAGTGTRWVIFALLGLLLVAGLVVGGGVVWAMRQVNPPGGEGAEVEIVVPPGAATSEIADLLTEKGVVANASVFRWYISWKDAGPFKAGTYTLRENMAMGDAIALLEEPAKLTFVKVTFPEGYTVAQAAARLQEKVPRLSAQAFADAARAGVKRSIYQPEEVTSLEGLLFPDTYQVYQHETEADVLVRMVDLLDTTAGRAGIGAKAPALGVTPYQALVIASMIEREAKADEDRAKIARVIYNRLAEGMPLQIDATVLYAIGQPVERLTFAMIEATESPYNTYKVTGLPPTPIAMPGKKSIEAALNPAEGPWKYYVVIDATGRHAFATTLAEHEANIAQAERNGVR